MSHSPRGVDPWDTKACQSHEVIPWTATPESSLHSQKRIPLGRYTERSRYAHPSFGMGTVQSLPETVDPQDSTTLSQVPLTAPNSGSLQSLNHNAPQQVGEDGASDTLYQGVSAETGDVSGRTVAVSVQSTSNAANSVGSSASNVQLTSHVQDAHPKPTKNPASGGSFTSQGSSPAAVAESIYLSPAVSDAICSGPQQVQGTSMLPSPAYNAFPDTGLLHKASQPHQHVSPAKGEQQHLIPIGTRADAAEAPSSNTTVMQDGHLAPRPSGNTPAAAADKATPAQVRAAEPSDASTGAATPMGGVSSMARAGSTSSSIAALSAAAGLRSHRPGSASGSRPGAAADPRVSDSGVLRSGRVGSMRGSMMGSMAGSRAGSMSTRARPPSAGLTRPYSVYRSAETAGPSLGPPDMDVAIMGAGVAGLAAALALKRVKPNLRVKVYDHRPKPSENGLKVGAYCRLEPNGLKAAQAIHPRLYAAIRKHGVVARPVLVHDTDGSLITRLEEKSTSTLRRYGQPYVTIGWAELEQILLSLLPSGTVQYSSTYRSHREYDPLVQLGIGVSSKAAAKAAPICPEPTPMPGQALEESAVQVYNTMRTRVLGLAREPAAPPTDASKSAYDMGASVFTRPDYQTGTSGHAMGGDGAAAADEAVRHSDDEAAVDALCGGLHGGQDGTAAAGRRSHPGAPNQAHGGGRNDVQGAIPSRYYSQSTPRGGAYEGLALEPSSYPDDGIGYEAAGLEGEETPEEEEEEEDEEMLVNVKAKLLVACDGPFSEIRQRVLGDGLPTFDGVVKWLGRLPGDYLPSLPLDHNAVWLAPGQSFLCHPLAGGDVGWEAVITQPALAAHGWRYNTDSKRVEWVGPGAPPENHKRFDSLQKLWHLFAAFPPVVRAILQHSAPASVLEAGVWVRGAAMPAGLGRGRVVIIGEAAHPMRPSAQEENQALEDAWELGACVQERGAAKDALRRFEERRRPRWRHVMQLAMAANAVPCTASSVLSAALLDYTSDLHARNFKRLAGPWRMRAARAVHALVKAASFTGLGVGVAAAASRSPALRGAADRGLERLQRTRVYRRVKEALRAAEKPLDPVVSVATHPGRTVEKGVEKATEVVTDAAVAVGGAAASAASRSIKHRLQRALGAF